MSVDVVVTETAEAAALEAERLYHAGYGPVLIHRLTREDGQRVVDYLRSRPVPVPCRFSPPQESAAILSAAIRAQPDIVHVYVELDPKRSRKFRDARWRR